MCRTIEKRDTLDYLSLESNVVIIRSEYDTTGSAASLLDAQGFGDEAVTCRL